MTSLKPPLAATEDQNGTVHQDNGGLKLRFSRSPHPYHRRSESISTNKEPVGLQDGASSKPQRKRHSSSDSSASGTEADDERGSSYLRRLPAPPLRARKGLRGGTPFSQTPAISPLPSPPGVHQEDSKSYFENFKSQKDALTITEEEKIKLREKYTKRKRAELTRRGAETLLLAGVSLATYYQATDAENFRAWKIEIAGLLAVAFSLGLMYPFRLAFSSFCRGETCKEAIRTGFHVPSRFDPGPLLYPIFVPSLVAASLFQHNPALLLPNLMLGISSLPAKLVPWAYSYDSTNHVHWALATMPLVMSKVSSAATQSLPPALKTASQSSIGVESLILLHPLHKTLLRTLDYLVTTSLDPAELQLLSVALINLFLFSSTPQAQILKALLWLGGLALFLSCQHVLGWEVTLARIPSWKFQQRRRSANNLLRGMDIAICQRLSSFGTTKPAVHSSSEEEGGKAEIVKQSPLKKTLTLDVRSPLVINGHAPHSSAVEFHGNRWIRSEADDATNDPPKRARRNTFSFEPFKRVTRSGRHKRSMTPNSSSFLWLTPAQARVRKWIYALYVYAATLGIILVPIRWYVQKEALSLHEPFGWALSYLFGNIPQIRAMIISLDLQGWITLPQLPDPRSMVGWVERIRQTHLGAANTRLLLCGYCLVVLLTGIATVLRLTSVVEVDTRRKVFHGIMVAMLLPTIFVDPCFIALALALILSIFLLLDLFRASQLPPISKPLTNFLAPYVDGRDHRGPVVVSHIFLLIGCAVPLWLSLAGLPRTGSDPWAGWEVGAREVSMTSGVICVGMGDAAASLIGRRYGKTKWFWGGGKSVQGSMAFTVAVTIGLMVSYAWLVVGGWHTTHEGPWLTVLTKAVIAAAGASMTETLCTSANDNVIVPLALWLLVRGLDM